MTKPRLDYWRSSYLLPAIDAARHGDKLALVGTGDPAQYAAFARQSGYPIESIFDPLRLKSSGCEYEVYDINEEQVRGLVAMGVRTRVHDLTSGPLPERYATIICSDVIEHVDNPIAMLRNLRESLRPGGRIIITTPNANYWRNFVHPWYDEFHEHNFNLSDRHFRNLAARLGFQIVELCSFQARDARMGASLLSPLHALFAALGRGNSLLFVGTPA